MQQWIKNIAENETKPINGPPLLAYYTQNDNTNRTSLLGTSHGAVTSRKGLLENQQQSYHLSMLLFVYSCLCVLSVDMTLSDHIYSAKTTLLNDKSCI